MALFEFERGRLIPAQFGRPVDQGLGPEILESIRSQVLEVIGRPLFPVAWQVPESQTGPDGGPHCLTALDPSGQVVSVEVLQRLDAVSLVSAMGRLGAIAKLGWYDLACAYPGGTEAFREGWAEFRESMPPSVEAGPRLFLVVGDVDPGIDSALVILAQAGVEVHQIVLRQMSNGRRFLEVHPLSLSAFASRPQIGGHAAPVPQLEWSGESVADSQPFTPETVSAGEVVPPPAPETGGLEPVAPQGAHAFAPQGFAPQGVAPEGAQPLEPQGFAAPGAPQPYPPQPAAPEAAQGFAPQAFTPEPAVDPAPQQAQPFVSEVAAAPAAGTPGTPDAPATAAYVPLGFNAHGLIGIASFLGETTPLYCVPEAGDAIEVALTPSGTIILPDGTETDDVDGAYRWLVSRGDAPAGEGWRSFHLGLVDGPTLAEAITEMNSGYEQ